MGNIASANGATITVSVPNPAGNSQSMLDYKGMDGNAGTASVTIDGLTPGSEPTSLNFFGDSGALFKSLTASSEQRGWVQTGSVAYRGYSAQPCSPTAKFGNRLECNTINNHMRLHSFGGLGRTGSHVPIPLQS